MAFVVWLLAASFTVAALIKWLMTADPPPINDVYSQPSKWYTLKYLVFKALLWLRKRKQNQKVTGDNAGMGTKSRNSPEEMDKAQVLPKDQPKVLLTAHHVHNVICNCLLIFPKCFILKPVSM